MCKWSLKVTLVPSRICDLASFLAKMPMQAITKGDPGPIQDLWFSRHKLYHQSYLSIKAIKCVSMEQMRSKKYELMYILYIMKKDSYIDLFLVRNINFWIKYLSWDGIYLQYLIWFIVHFGLRSFSYIESYILLESCE